MTKGRTGQGRGLYYNYHDSEISPSEERSRHEACFYKDAAGKHFPHVFSSYGRGLDIPHRARYNLGWTSRPKGATDEEGLCGSGMAWVRHHGTNNYGEGYQVDAKGQVCAGPP